MGIPMHSEENASSSNLKHSLSLENILSHSQDGLIAFDLQGKIIALNEQAALILGKKPKQVINHYLWQKFKLDTLSRKRKFIQARTAFNLAKQGIAQQFIWFETQTNIPILAYNIMLYEAEIEGNSIIFAKLNDILSEKIREWILCSLSKISNYHEITEIIDAILKLASDVFSAKYAAVGLIDSQNTVRTVSYFHAGKKSENISYPLENSPSFNIQEEKKTYHFNEIQQQFPDNPFFKKIFD